MKQFSKKEALLFGWETFKKYPILLIGVTLTTAFVPSIVSYALQLPFQSNTEEYSPLMFIGTLASYLLSAFFTVGLIKFSLRLVDGKKVAFQDLFSVTADEFLRYIISGLIYSLIVIGGFILLVIPGIIWGIKYQYYGYLVIDKQIAPMDGIKESGRITQGHKMNLFLLALLVGLLNVLGFLALFVGVFIAAPVTGLAQAFVYRKLATK